MSTISQRARAVQAPIIPQVADWIRAHPGTLSLGQGVAGYSPPPQAWAALARLESEPAWHRYQAVGGLPELVDALRDKLARQNGLTLTPDRALMVTAGANAAFQQVILAICDPGDEVLLPLPYYFNQEMALSLANARPVTVAPAPGNFLPDLEALERAVTARTRAVVTVSPNNPTGAVYPEELLRSINTLCRERGLFHITDETYEAFTYGASRHVSPGRFPDSAAHTISLFSFSKAYGFASWRIGYVVFPAELVDAMRKIQDTLLICPPVVSQLAAWGCLQAGDAWLNQRRAEVEATRHCVLAGLKELEGLAECAPADGAFYVFLRLAGDLDSLELTRRLIALHRVAVIPGSAFGWQTPCCLRIAYGALTPSTAAEGVGRLVAGLRQIA